MGGITNRITGTQEHASIVTRHMMSLRGNVHLAIAQQSYPTDRNVARRNIELCGSVAKGKFVVSTIMMAQSERAPRVLPLLALLPLQPLLRPALK